MVAIFGLLALVACTFEGAPGSGPQAERPDGGLGQSDATPTESDATMSVDECEPSLVLKSTKFHDPPMLVADSRVYAIGVWLKFNRPSEIDVTEGNAGDRCAYLDYVSNEGRQIRCAYEGRGQGTRFVFLDCQDAGEASFSACGDAQDSQDRVMQQPIRASAITLSVDGDAKLSATVGQLAISGTCEPE